MVVIMQTFSLNSLISQILFTTIWVFHLFATNDEVSNLFSFTHGQLSFISFKTVTLQKPSFIFSFTSYHLHQFWEHTAKHIILLFFLNFNSFPNYITCLHNMWILFTQNRFTKPKWKRQIRRRGMRPNKFTHIYFNPSFIICNRIIIR